MANFNYVANVKCVNGTNTWVEAVFPLYNGVLENDITAISVTGPSGLITDDKADFIFFEDMNHALCEIVGQVPELGTYTFSITIGGETIVLTDVQSINRTLPVVDMSVTTPAPGTSVTTDTTFTWSAVPDPGFPVYYGIQIITEAEVYVTNVRYVGDFSYAVNLPVGNYKWQVIVMDGIDWKTTNNRTHNNWNTFTII